jgi:hypothetical protein
LQTRLTCSGQLYFAASIDKIHITVPRDLRQTLPGVPDLVLDLPRTPAGVDIGGYIDESIPHCVNHIKVGDFGSLEVILIACDDGDVLAYYTHLFPEEIHRQDPQVQAPISSTVPFFLENVGSSTWGLALRKFTDVFLFQLIHDCLHTDISSSLQVLQQLWYIRFSYKIDANSEIVIRRRVAADSSQL